MKPLSAGELTERVTVEQLSSGAWALVAVLFASVLPGGTAAAPPVLIPELAIAAQTQPYTVRVRYRTDLGANMRIRWGSKTLAINTIVDPDNRRHELTIETGTVPDYTDLHAAALAAIAREGFAITFSKDSTSGYDAPTDTAADPAASTSAIAGFAKWIPGGKPTQKDGDTAVETASPKLLFIPTTLGDEPLLNAVCSIDSVPYALETVDPIAPDGAAIGAYLTVAR